jgi:hypothetical protein
MESNGVEWESNGVEWSRNGVEVKSKWSRSEVEGGAAGRVAVCALAIAWLAVLARGPGS